MKLRPDFSERLPLVFDAGEELTGKSANHYVGDDAQPVTPEQIRKALAGGKKMVRLTLKVRYRSDPVDAPLRVKHVFAVVDGGISAEDLGRLVHRIGRSLYASGGK